MPQMDPELLVLGRLMRAMEAVPGEERRVRICRFLMSRCSETWPIDMKAPGPPWDQLTLWHSGVGMRTVGTPEPGDQDRGQVRRDDLLAKEEVEGPVLTGRSEPPAPSQPETPEVWTPPPAAPVPLPAPAPAAPPSGIPATPPPTGYPVPAPGQGQPDAGLDGLG